MQTTKRVIYPVGVFDPDVMNYNLSTSTRLLMSFFFLMSVIAPGIAIGQVSVVGYWMLDEEVGSTLVVDTNATSDGVPHGDVVLGVLGVSDDSTAASFDGSGDWIEIPHHDDFLLDDGSVVLWFRADSISGRKGILSKDSTSFDTGGHLSIFLESDGRIKVRLQTTTGDHNVYSTSTAQISQWHHVALIFGTNGMELYFDGVLEDTDSYEGGLGTTSGGIGNYEPIVLGANSWGSDNLLATPLIEYFTGTIDEVSIFSGRLDSSEVAGLAGIPMRDTMFTDISVISGFNESAGTGANGLHWGDMDSDGDLDVIITGTSARLLWNDASAGTFSERTLGNMPRQGAIGDFDNDGDLDFWHRNLVLWENIGLGAMINRGSLGFFSPYNNENVSAMDINADGRLDLAMCSQDGNWIALNSDPGEEETTRIVFGETKDSADGLYVSGGYGNGDFCSTADVNNDGYLDIFYHYSDGELFLSDGDGTFTHHSTAIQVLTGNSDKMGSAFGDYDNDGDMDLWVSRYDSGQRGYLWRNNGDGSFTEVAYAAGITDTGNQRGCAWGDYDNDGDLDLAIARQGQGLIVYQNDGDGTFTQSSDFPYVTGDTTDVCFVDINNDGNLDLSITREAESSAILRNDSDSTDYFILRYVGNQLVNGAGIGVRMELWDASDTTFIARREIGIARGYGGQEPLWVHFGGITPSSTYSLRVYEPGSTTPRKFSVIPENYTTSFSNETIAHFLTITEGKHRLRVVQWKEIGSEGNR